MPASTQVTLSGYHCEWIPLDLKLIAPAHGFVGTPMVVTYELKNRSSQLVQLDVGIEGSEAFMFAGYKQVKSEMQFFIWIAFGLFVVWSIYSPEIVTTDRVQSLSADCRQCVFTKVITFHSGKCHRRTGIEARPVKVAFGESTSNTLVCNGKKKKR